MTPLSYPVTFPAEPSVMPQARMAQQPSWTPAPRAKPAVARSMQRPVASSLAGRKMGQGDAELVARGSDIVFSFLTSLAAMVSGVAIAVTFGKGESGAARPAGPPGMPRPASSRPAQARPIWYFIGGFVTLMGAANIWSSVNRAVALQPLQQTVSNGS